jgi:hypothetical protein
MGRSQQVVDWPLELGRDVRTKTCVSGKGIFPKSRVLSEEEVLRAKGRGKLLNRSHIGRCNDHHHLIMNSERMKNHGACITYTLQLLSVVLYMPRSVLVARMCCENIRLALKPLVTMDSMSLGMITALTYPVINFSCSACILFTSQVYALFVILPTIPEFLEDGNPISISCVTNLVQPFGSVLNPPRVQNSHVLHHGNIPEHKERGMEHVGPKTQSLALVNGDPNVRSSFEEAGCMSFCKKIQGFNMKLVEQFVLSFNGLCAVILGNTLQVTEETLSVATKIPPHGERWSKGMPLDVLCYEEFIKSNCLNRKVEVGILSRYLQEPFRKLLRAIRKYFTCEGRFDIIHTHHIRLLMHFTGRRPLNLPFFLHQSL